MRHSSPPFLLFLRSSLRLPVPRMPPVAQSIPPVHKTTLGETGQATPEVSTEEIVRILASGTRAAARRAVAGGYAIAHIPGSINLYEKEVDLVRQRYPDKATRLVFYCNGPFCGKSKRLSEQLVALGYTNDSALSTRTAGLAGAWATRCKPISAAFRYIYNGDKTAVYVDARGPLRRRRDGAWRRVHSARERRRKPTKMAACLIKTRARASSSLPTHRRRHGRLPKRLRARRTGTAVISVEHSQT